MKTVLFLLSLLTFNPLICQDFISGPYTQWECGEYAIADFDGDGYNDIFGILYNFEQPEDIYLYLNKKSKPVNFTKKLIFSAIDLNGSIDAADYDKDGDIDVLYATGTTSYALNVFINDGAGVFTSKALDVTGSNELKFYDLDNDNDLDIVGVNSLIKRLDIYINDGAQVYTKKSVVSAGKSIVSFDVADVDGDKDADIVIGYDASSGEQVVLWQNNGLNTFVKKVIQANDFYNLVDVMFTDINKDGKQDIVGLSLGSVWSWLNTGGQTFENKVLVAFFEYNARAMDIADFNGDGLPDLVVTSNSNGLFWFENTSKENLTYTRKIVGGVSPGFKVNAADMDKDGDKDIVVINDNLWWYNNNITQLPSTTGDVISFDFNVFPNPVEGNMVQISGSNSKEYAVEIIDIMGKSVLKTITVDAQLDSSSLRSGTYLVRISDTSGLHLGSCRMVKL